MKRLSLLLAFLLLLSGCSPAPAPTPPPTPAPEPPEEIVNFSDDFAAGRKYRIIGSGFDMDVMDSYPQHIVGEPKPIGFQDSSLDITLAVKNQKYDALDLVSIKGQVYPLTVQPYLEETDATAWSGELVSKFAADIEGDDVMTYVANAAEAVSKVLVYDSEMARRFMGGTNKIESAESSLETGRRSQRLHQALCREGLPGHPGSRSFVEAQQHHISGDVHRARER